MTEKRRFTREEMRSRLRDMMRELGVDIPDKIQRREVIVYDKKSNIAERFWIGEDAEEEKDD